MLEWPADGQSIDFFAEFGSVAVEGYHIRTSRGWLVQAAELKKKL